MGECDQICGHQGGLRKYSTKALKFTIPASSPLSRISQRKKWTDEAPLRVIRDWGGQAAGPGHFRYAPATTELRTAARRSLQRLDLDDRGAVGVADPKRAGSF